MCISQEVQRAGLIPQWEGPMEMPFVSLGLNCSRLPCFIRGLFWPRLLTANFWAFESCEKRKIGFQTISCTDYQLLWWKAFVGKALLNKDSLNNCPDFLFFLLSS